MHHLEIVSRLEGEHVDHLEELIEDATRVDHHEPIGEHKFLRLQQGDDLGMAMLAYVSDELAGYAHTLTYGPPGKRRVSCEIVVHPEYRRKGIGSMLLKRAIEHAHNESATRIDLWAYNDSTASKHMARAFSFKEVRRLLHMHRHPGEPPQPAAPEGASLRTFRSGEDEMLVRLNNRIFEGHPEQGAWTLEDFRARAQQKWFNPTDILVLQVHGVPAGFCWVKVEERGTEGRVGEIYVIGTTPEYRGRGLGRFLLSKALQHLSSRRINAVAVYVDESNAAAVRLYESFDFHHHHVDICYALALENPAAAVTSVQNAARPDAAAMD